MVERVQRRATKLVPELKDLPYEERLRQLRLPSLYYSRRRGEMIGMFTIMMGVEHIDPVQMTPFHYTRGHRYKIYIQALAQKMIRRHCPRARAIVD